MTKRQVLYVITALLLCILFVLWFAPSCASKSHMVCHICKCGYSECDNVCYHKHATSHRDYTCRMACHCYNAVKNHASCTKPPQHRDVMEGNSPELTQLYAQYDFSYFNAQLPLVTVQVTDAKEDWMGQTTQCGPRCFEVVISNPWTPAPIEKYETLLHEMCHISIDMNDLQEFDVHGPHFQACMHNLDRQNAFVGLR